MRLLKFALLLILLLISVSVVSSCNENIETQHVPKTIPGFIFLKDETFECGGEKNTVKIYCHDKTGLEFVLVPGGSYRMGYGPRDYDEKPVHTVNIKPFLICRTECTHKAWFLISAAEERERKSSDLPIRKVNWDDSTSWCHKAGLRLPTEAEWEYSCRAGSTTQFCFGDSDSNLGDYAWYKRNSAEQVQSVAQKQPNAFGLFDMHGNLWEWCQD